jgi:RNA polymerase sigma factor (sigma-70 family)
VTGSPPEVHGRDAARLDDLWREHAVRVQAYALRHTDPDIAQDVLAEVFLVAWRRIADVPDPALPWLLVVARNLIRNAERTRRRRERLTEVLARLETATGPSPDVVAADRDAMLRSLAELTGTEREALLLVAWDGLDPADAARVAGCTRAAFHVRLHRARRRLAAAEQRAGSPSPADDAPVPAPGSPTRPATTDRRPTSTLTSSDPTGRPA